jgi:hypothetical protein
VALVAGAAVEVHILGFFPDWNSWLTPLVLALVVIAAVALVVVRILRRLDWRIGLTAMSLGGISLLLTPFIWSEYTVAHASASMTPSAGPNGQIGFGGRSGGRGPGVFGGRGFRFGEGGRGFARNGGLREFGRAFSGGGGGFAPGGGFPGAGRFRGGAEGFRFPSGAGGGFSRGGPGGFGGTTANSKLVRFLETHQGKTKYMVAVMNASAAEPFILSTNRAVMDLGGFMDDRIVDAKGLAKLVSENQVRYFLVSGRGGGGGFATVDRSSTSLRISTDRLRESGSGGFTPGEFGNAGRFGGSAGGFRGGPGGSNADLTTWVMTNCKVVPSTQYEAATSTSIGGTQPLYDCGAYAAAHPVTPTK